MRSSNVTTWRQEAQDCRIGGGKEDQRGDCITIDLQDSMLSFPIAIFGPMVPKCYVDALLQTGQPVILSLSNLACVTFAPTLCVIANSPFSSNSTSGGVAGLSLL